MQCSFCKTEVQSFDGLCPSCHKALGAVPATGLQVTGAQRVMSREAAAIVDQKPTIIQPRVSKDEGGAMKFRPRMRPPMLVLCVWDDDGQDGHWVRVYGDRSAIGRSEGDLILPHDAGPLHHGQVLLIGSGRYRFQCVAPGAAGRPRRGRTSKTKSLSNGPFLN